ncbi:hypothetical protein SCB49_11899 [unidentified eubacterium SCB49]|nr:hypothetical protein SCB49_11899 [unidentified eubacterium SCB49]
MKTKLLVTFSILVGATSFAQIDFATHVISENSKNANTVFATDIDGDGDLDVISSTGSNDTLAWYENIDGKGFFSNQIVITTNADNPYSIFSADIDNNGTMDVLSASGQDNKIAWYKNDGKGNFGKQLIITTEAQRAYSVYATDVDGDGDLDVLSGSLKDHKVAWYENLDGQGNFSAQKTIATDVYLPYSIYSDDIDNDGDNDIIASSASNSKILWFKNKDGKGNFKKAETVSNTIHGATKIVSIDMDGDNDLDILSASLCSNEIIWYENEDGKGTFSSENIISNQTSRAKSVFAIDMDGDGDNDVLSASFTDGKIAWYENTNGKGNFGEQIIISDTAKAAQAVFAADIDGDGDIDVLSASGQGDGVVWYENLNKTIEETNLDISFEYRIYPNPASKEFNIRANSPVVQVQVFNQLNQLVMNINNPSGIETVNVSRLSSAMYHIKIKDVNDNIGMLKLIKND